VQQDFRGVSKTIVKVRHPQHLFLTSHAVSRAMERFNLSHDEAQSKIAKVFRYGRTVGTDGRFIYIRHGRMRLVVRNYKNTFRCVTVLS
jgi:hypothetical protein